MSEPQQIALQGVSHLALVCSDMARTVDFYTNVLGLPLIKTIELPAGMGQHFFLDIGNGDSLAFFWFPDAAEPQAGLFRAVGSRSRGFRLGRFLAFGGVVHAALILRRDGLECRMNARRKPRMPGRL